MTVITEASDKLLGRVRKLLAKAEDEGVTQPEAEALTAKAAELMAKYGIDQALLAASRPETDQPASRMIDIDNPWGRVRAHLLCGIAAAMRCQAVMLTGNRSGGVRIHVFGYRSDIERMDLLYTSVLLQMFTAHRRAPAPQLFRSSPKAWNRSWLLGYATAVIARVRAAEQAASAASASAGETSGSGLSAALVLADRKQVIAGAVRREYPVTRSTRLTYSGSGYAAGHCAGQNASLGGTSVERGARGALR
jgi:Protein of unknown function (DUF2786)